MGLPARGLVGQSMGGLQVEQPMFCEEGIWPALVIDAAGDAPPLGAFAQEASQPPAYPLVERTERRVVAVLEVSEPAAQRPVEIGDDARQAVPRGAFGLVADRVLELSDALVARPVQV